MLLSTTLALGMPQSQFVGKWQTRVSRATNKPAIAVIIVELHHRLGSAVVLVNPDASEIKLPMGTSTKQRKRRGNGYDVISRSFREVL